MQAHLGTGLKNYPIVQREHRCLLPVSRLPRQMNKFGENGRAVAGFIHAGSGIRKGRLVWGVFLGSFFVRTKNEQTMTASIKS